MDRKPSTPPFSTWEFFSACVHYLGKSALTALFQKGQRQIERWSADPATSDSHQRNPLDRYEMLLQQLVDAGQGDISRSAVARQAHIVGCELREKDLPEPDKPTVELEIIDDLLLKTRYDEALLDPKATREACRDALDRLIRELKENYVRKCMERGWDP